MVIYFKWFDSWYCYVTSNNFFRILAESFKQGCQYRVLRVEMNYFRKDNFYWNKLSISISFRILKKKIFKIRRKKIKTFRTAFNMPGGQIVWKNVNFGFLTILYICLNCDGNTFESSAKKSPVGCPNCLVRFQMKDSNETTFFRTFHIQIFSQTLSGKYPAVVWKPIFTRADEPMKKGVSIRRVRFPKKFSEFEEDLSGLDWNISAWLEILHSTRSKKELNRKFFETISVSQSLPGFEWNLI